MSESAPPTETPPTPPPSTATTAAPTSTTTYSWKLPDGIEDHIEAGLIKTAAGVAVGGILGMIMFRSGKGMRAASVASGVGVALGSSFERYQAQYGSPFPTTTTTTASSK